MAARSCGFPSGTTRHPCCSFDYYEPVARREIRPLAASKGWIKVEKGAAYTLSCYLRASKEDVPALLGSHGQGTGGRRQRAPASSETEHRVEALLPDLQT